MQELKLKSTNKQVELDRKKYIANTAQISYYPLSLNSGDGAYLYDEDGKKYIDFLSSASSANLGHANEEIAQAVYEQMLNISQYTFAYFNHNVAIDAAKRITNLIDYRDDMKVLFSTTGSAAIDSAIKLVRAKTGRTKLISMYEAYHGSTFGSLSLSALSLNMRRKIGPLLPEVYHFHYPTKDKSWQECIAEMEYAFEKYLPPEEVAAIFIEPIAGDMGLVDPPRQWLLALREICDKYGMLLVDDEIQLGLCRTGKNFCIEHFDVIPDVYVMGKSLGGGLPVGAVMARADIMDALDPPAHLFTLGASQASMAACAKNLEILERIDANSLSLEKGAYLEDKFLKLKEKYDFIGDIRAYGLSIGVDIINPKTGGKYPEACAKICHTCLKNGLIQIFLNRSTLRVQPPLIISYDQIDEAMAIMEDAMEKFDKGQIPDTVLSEISGW
ncbi:MAG: aminotransferase class III-fold pyridoxal phosphate-dependent enzyme [Tissierellia bacterium]|nr:aminotransferase class III-fold pyridoxal phosphate-dependent enzyme [Tissierellia bacterium]